MDKELVNTLFEGIIAVVTLPIAAYLAISAHGDPTLLTMASSWAILVLTFWYGQRGQVKAVNGNITALANIATQVNTTREQAASTAASTALQAVTQHNQQAHPEVGP